MSQHGPSIICQESILRTRYNPCHVHDTHELFFCGSGKGWQRLDGWEIPMKKGDFFIFPKGHPHIGATEQDRPCRALVMYISDNVFSNDPDMVDARKTLSYLCERAEKGDYFVPLEPGSERLVEELFLENISSYMSKEPGFKLKLKANLATLFLHILRDSNHAEILQKEIAPVKVGERMFDVLAYIRANYMNPITIEDVIQVGHISRSHFHAVFKEETGQTFLEYLNRERCRQASAMLRATDLPIVMIAEECGFSCLSHFYHIFKTFTNTTPLACRKSSYFDDLV